MTKILFCTCIHKFQNDRYGPQNRVHNKVTNEVKYMGKWRCTVCSNVKR